MKVLALILAFGFAICSTAGAQQDGTQQFFRVVSGSPTVLMALSSDGWLTWSNATVTGTCTIERAHRLTPPVAWLPYSQETVTSFVMHARCQGIDTEAPENVSSFTALADDGVVTLSSGVAASATPTKPPAYSTLVAVEGGSFYMGNDWGSISGNPDAEPAHRVTVDGFSISKYEITNDEMAEILN